LSTQTKKFVIQEHATADSVHWDLMLESGDHLQTWRLDKNPAEVVSHSVEAVKIFDHPLKFLTYEGPVNQGKGKVKITEAGTYQIMHADSENMELHMNGGVLKDIFTLSCIKNDQWRFSRNPDRHFAVHKTYKNCRSERGGQT
jgi:hypothetical protein